MPALQPHSEIITLEQYETLPEDVRAEVGVREYWIVDSRRKTVTVNFFEENILSVQYSFDSTIKVNIYDDLLINFSDIAELLND